MPYSLELLTFASAATVAASASLTAFGLRRQRHAGWGWWLAAMWLATLGTGLGAVLTPAGQGPAGTAGPGPVAAALATLLLLQWPVLAVLGLRRFHARHAWPGSARIDASVLTAAATTAALASTWAGPEAAWLVLACSLGAHLYAATLLFLGPEGRDSTPLQGLGAAIAVVGLAPGLLGWPHEAGTGGLAARGAAAAIGVIVLAFVVLTLVCERTERQLRVSRRRLRTLANVDALTQVPNRRHFHELATSALRHDPPGTAVLLLFDVDHFKQINDHLGHAAGDRALCLVSGSVMDHLRAPDVAGRHGGDEFVLLLRRATTRVAMGVAARIVTQVQQQAPQHQLPALSLSFGLVQVGAAEDIDAALRRADQALYEAKRQGRSRAVAAQGNEDRPVFSESQRLGLTGC